MNKIIRNFKNETTMGKIRIIFMMVLFVAVLIAVTLYALGLSIRNFPGNDPTMSPFHYAFNSKIGKPVSLVFIGIILVFVLVLFLSVNKKNYTKTDDERGVHFMGQGTHGTAEWMSKERAKEVFTVTDIRNTNEVVYGQYTKNGEEVVGYKKPVGAEFNRNILVMAPSGSGKSYTQVRTYIIQHAKAGHSLAVTDPDGGLYGDLGVLLRDMGIDVQIIHLADPAYSMCWNIIEECINPDTERLDGIRLTQFVEVFMTNTGKGKEDFWYKSAVNLVKAVIGYTSYWHENVIIAGYKKLYLKIVGKDVAVHKDEFFKKLNTSLVSFKWCRQYISYIAIKNGYRKEDIDKVFRKIHEYADVVKPFTLQVVYDYIINFKTVEDDMESGLSPIEKWHPAYTNYVVYKTNDTDQVRKAAIQGAQLRFDLFIDHNITYMLSHKGIDLKQFNMRQTALFVVTQDKSSETKPIASLLFTFLFKDIQDVYDKNKNLYYGTDKPNPCLGSAIILDDFFSLGVINGDPEDFGRTMADARKREVYITIVVQQYNQIEALYGPLIKDSIQGNCATLVYLGGNDPSTIEFISEFSGEATVLDESHDESSRLLSLNALSPGYRASTAKRNVVTKGEARTWRDKVLVFQQGEQPLELKPFTWIELPEYIEGKCKKSSIYHDIIPIYDREDFMNETGAEEEERITREYDDTFISLVNYDVDEDSGEITERRPVQEAEQQTSGRNQNHPEPESSIKDEEHLSVKERAVEEDYYVEIDFADLKKGE